MAIPQRAGVASGEARFFNVHGSHHEEPVGDVVIPQRAVSASGDGRSRTRGITTSA